ncbi:DUF4229 domain-containing protein [Pseudoclavibacter sp. 13-3]|uniref:DUF4229 domain-containing protein n=1 Tax=Pseudoclavibacter sp. 13-3 TaxID=2901228 RepID=UPI001E323622|nr:DUF4229 domain-containing protein [Pseudoclavibacter sp. 13-3]
MKKLPAWLVYTLLRVGVVLVALIVLLLLGFNPFVAALIAVVVGLLVSYLALGRQRQAFGDELARRRAHPEEVRAKRRLGRVADDIEDAELDEAERQADGTAGDAAKSDDAAKPDA